MTRIAFIGLGNMGGGMAARQAVAGREVQAFDLSQAAIAKVVDAGAKGAASVTEAVKDADVVITMLPAGPHVRKVYADDILPNAPKSALLIDCSTIDVDSARAVAMQASSAGFRFADAPVSGGTAAADAGTLAFMVGCDEAAFALAEKLGLAPDRFFEIASKSSGQCWSLSTYAPWPGVGPQTASDRNYEGGFAASMMLKDLKLAQEAAARAGATTPMGNSAEALYALFDRLGFGGKDFSGVLQMLRGDLGCLAG